MIRRPAVSVAEVDGLAGGQRRTDLVAAWVTGAGVGFATLMPAWMTASRLAGLAWDAPAGPIVGIVTAFAGSVAVALVAGRRLARRVGVSSPAP